MTHAADGDARMPLRKEKQQYVGMLYCLPYVVVFLMGTILPILYALYLSFFKERMVGGSRFVGLKNFVRAVSDAKLWESFGRVSLYFLIQVPLMLALALLAALILDSGVIAALMWGYIYGQRNGLIGQFFQMFGAQAPNLLSADAMLFSISNIARWCFMGYNMLIFYASLRVIPGELYESARIDGASEFRIAWSVKIPMIRSTVIMTLLFSIIGSYQLFNEPNILKTLVPEVINSYYTPNMYPYNLAFTGQDINYAAAVSLVVGSITMLIVAAVKLFGSRWEER